MTKAPGPAAGKVRAEALVERFRSRIQFAIAAAALAGGLALAGLDMPGAARWVWASGAGIVLAALLVEIVRALSQGRFGLDLLAALSMAGSLALGEELAGAVIALMLSGGQLLEAFAEGRARREMTALLARAPRRAQRYVDGRLEDAPLEDIAPGDRLLVRPGDTTPVDGIVAVREAVLDEAALTGEPLPRIHAVGDEVMSGAVNAGGAFDLVASRPAAESTYAGIVRLVAAAQASRAPMARLADRYALGFLAVSVALAGAAWLASGDPTRALAVLVVATPCPLILAVPVAIVAGVSRCAHRGVLVKSAGALETLGRVRTLLLDKTGTLTGGAPVVVGVHSAGRASREEVLRSAGSLAQASPHVVSAAIAGGARRSGLALSSPLDVVESPGAGLSGEVDGAPVSVGSFEHVAASAQRCAWADDHRASAEAAGRMTAFVGVGGRFAGAITLADVVRPDAREALAALRREGVTRIVLVTGDSAAVAHAVADGLGIDEVIAQATPAQKVEAVRAASGGGATMMVGDGVNDAPALAAADVGVAMGSKGAAASAEAADVVILVDSLDRLPEAVRTGRLATRIAIQSVLVGIGLSTAGMIAASFGLLTPLEGALAQEAIDVAVILNALRALSI
ncbi:heavy metal translocating P-type ATPase [Alsobacter sp. KACC 23698]|uniref:P-type Zn(2+) transporter n=1 Tax=Alsobacter sp. KACC 23698 TaxID=3149229 RepID=A0AAU7JMY4_9HYPH